MPEIEKNGNDYIAKETIDDNTYIVIVGESNKSNKESLIRVYTSIPDGDDHGIPDSIYDITSSEYTSVVKKTTEKGDMSTVERVISDCLREAHDILLDEQSKKDEMIDTIGRALQISKESLEDGI